MTNKQNPIELDAIIAIQHSAQMGIAYESYMDKVSDYGRKEDQDDPEGVERGMTTKQYMVTASELSQIKNDCEFPETVACDGCLNIDPDLGCKWKGANLLEEEILNRPNSLDVLEAWDHYNISHFGMPHPLFFDMIRLVREDIDGVVKSGIEKGWWSK